MTRQKMDRFEITFVRHAQSTGNAEDRIQGQNDEPLTSIGIQQAESLGNYWETKKVSFDQILTSTQPRARQTAEIIASKLNMSVHYDEAWKERAFGSFEGETISNLLAQNPPPDFFHPYNPVGGEGESLVDLYLRASRAILDLILLPPARYLIVSHGAILNMVLYSILGLSPLNYMHGPRFYFLNTGFTELTYEPITRIWRMLSFNQHPHWDKEFD